jgi:hypothetical protein
LSLSMRKQNQHSKLLKFISFCTLAKTVNKSPTIFCFRLSLACLHIVYSCMFRLRTFALILVLLFTAPSLGHEETRPAFSGANGESPPPVLCHFDGRYFRNLEADCILPLEVAKVSSFCSRKRDYSAIEAAYNSISSISFCAYGVPAQAQSELSSSNDFSISIEKTDFYQVVRFSGEIRPLTNTHDLSDVISQLDRDKITILEVSDSGGGYSQAFRSFMRRIKRRSRSVWMVVNGSCRSSCTYWATMADYTFGVDGQSKIGVHRQVISPFGIQKTVSQQINHDARMGASRDWLEANPQIYMVDDNDYYFLSIQESEASGHIDHHFSSVDALSDWLKKYARENG